jgi:hypothetical protein
MRAWEMDAPQQTKRCIFLLKEVGSRFYVITLSIFLLYFKMHVSSSLFIYLFSLLKALAPRHFLVCLRSISLEEVNHTNIINLSKKDDEFRIYNEKSDFSNTNAC